MGLNQSFEVSYSIRDPKQKTANSENQPCQPVGRSVAVGLVDKYVSQHACRQRFKL